VKQEEELKAEEQSSEEPEKVEEVKETEGSDTADMFEDRQKQFLNGRIATKTVVDNDGTTIISQDEKITEDIIETAKAKGKLIELIMNNKA
jgi:hypothetical protein